MIAWFDGIRDLSFIAVLIRLALACFCGTVIGLERSYKNRPAGFRTHILVCMGAALAASTGLYLVLEARLPADVSRISGQVISGLGFIGAGTIVITKKMDIKGLTTAAGLWTTGIIGLALGSGYYELGILGTVLVLLAETWFAVIGGSIRKNPEYQIEVCYDEKTSLDNVLRFCKDSHMSIVNLRIQANEQQPNEENSALYSAEVTLRGNVECSELLTKIRRMKGVISALGL